MVLEFKKIYVNESKFLVGIPILDIRYEYFKSQNNNPFHLLHDQKNYILADCFIESETTKCNINKFYLI